MASQRDHVIVTFHRVGAPRPTRRRWLVVFAVAVVVQLVVLYLPRAPATPSGLAWLDKVVHAGVFAAAAVSALPAGLRARWVGPVFAGHALLSEVVQARLLADRSGDPFDVLADLCGVGAGLVVGARLRAGARHG